MKYIVITFRGGGKIKLPANILKSIDVPDDFTVNKEGEDTNKRICISYGCYVDSLDKTISLEQQLPNKKCYTSDDFSNNELVNNGDYNFLEEVLNSYTHDGGLVAFSTTNGIITGQFAYKEGEEVVLVPIAHKNNNEIAYVYSNTKELNVGIEVYGDKNGNAPASDGEYRLYENIDIEVPDVINRFTVENGVISELLAEEPVDEGGVE